MEELHTSLLLPTELISGSDQILALDTFPSDPFLAQLRTLVRNSSTRLGVALARIRKSRHTALLARRTRQERETLTANPAPAL